MDELVACLQGRYSALPPHRMNIGQAPQALGWTAEPDWTRDGGLSECVGIGLWPLLEGGRAVARFHLDLCDIQHPTAARW